MSSKFAAAFGAEFPPCATFPLTNKQVHVQISSSLCSALKFILILKRAALLLATSLRLLFLKPHWEFSPRVFPFPVRASRCYSCAVFSFRMCQDLIPPLLFFKKKGKMAIKVDWSEYMKSSIYEWYRYDFVLFFSSSSLWKMIIHWHLSWSQREYFLYFINEPSGYLLWLCCLPVSARVCSVVL